VVRWSVVYAKHALKDAKKLKAAGLKEKAQELLVVLATVCRACGHTANDPDG
jgi:toxin YoeB